MLWRTPLLVGARDVAWLAAALRAAPRTVVTTDDVTVLAPRAAWRALAAMRAGALRCEPLCSSKYWMWMRGIRTNCLMKCAAPCHPPLALRHPATTPPCHYAPLPLRHPAATPLAATPRAALLPEGGWRPAASAARRASCGALMARSRRPPPPPRCNTARRPCPRAAHGRSHLARFELHHVDLLGGAAPVHQLVESAVYPA